MIIYWVFEFMILDLRTFVLLVILTKTQNPYIKSRRTLFVTVTLSVRFTPPLLLV